MLRSMFLGTAVAIGLALLAMPASAGTFNLTLDTVNQTNGYDITLTGLTTDSNNVAQSLVSGTVTGFGTDAFLTGTLTLLPLGSDSGVFNFDGKASGTAPYFSFSGSSGIDLADSSGNAHLNPYLGLDSNYYTSISISGGSPTNPGDLENVSATPLPATISMFAGGLGFVSFLAKRRKRKTADTSALVAA